MKLILISLIALGGDVSKPGHWKSSIYLKSFLTQITFGLQIEWKYGLKRPVDTLAIKVHSKENNNPKV